MRSLAPSAADPLFFNLSGPCGAAADDGGDCTNTIANRALVARDEGWSVSESMDLYHVSGWGFPYFSINDKGNMSIRPRGKVGVEELDLTAVIDKVLERGTMCLPFIIRFPEILDNRLHELHGAFQRAILLHSYKGSFQGVFPVKCNPDRFLIEDIVNFGRQLSFGLEAGSKPELMLAMACMCKASPDALLICNGYKDADYVKLALLARQLALNCVLVVEQQEEVELIVKMSRHLNIQPIIGVRAKLSTKHGGHWGETSGENGKFGLSASEIVDIAHNLRRNGMLDCLQLLHFHVGSQIPSLSIVEESVSEAAHFFCELKLMGADMKFLDIGGGLGIDYDGSGSAASDMSVGYTVQEYAEQVVEAIESACSMKDVKRPIVCCESGRGLVSHHSVLVFDVFSASRAPAKGFEDVRVLCEELEYESLPEELSAVSRQLIGFIKDESYAIALDYARNLKNDSARLFKTGLVSLELRALVEKLYEVLLVSMEERGSRRKKPGLELNGRQPATYHINLSMFKSMPDNWAIGQLFPIVPLQRLNEEPTMAAILSDLTCDSDGRIQAFISGDAYGKPSRSLPVHSLEAGRAYYMGLFLGGAYQEALSSMHNLFGTVHVVHVVSTGEDGGFRISREIRGQSVANVLRVAQHDPGCMFDALRSRVIKSLNEGRLDNECEARMALEMVAWNFSSYPYLSNDLQQGCTLDNICSTMESSAFCCS